MIGGKAIVFLVFFFNIIQFKVVAWAPKGEVWIWIHMAEVWAPAVVVIGL